MFGKTVFLWCLLLSASGALSAPIVLKPGEVWRSQPLPVVGGAQYSLKFNARIVGETSLEKNAQMGVAFHDADRVRKGLLLPEWQVEFKSPEGKIVRYGVLSSPWRVVLSGKWLTYRDGFNVPWGATLVQIVFRNRSKHDTLEAESPTVVESASPWVNVNPDFAFGEWSLSGYGRGGINMRLKTIRRPDGRGFYLEILRGVGLETIPVKGGHDYEIHAKVTEDGKLNGMFKVAFLDADGKCIAKAGGTMLVKAGSAGGTVDNFIAPSNALYMQVNVPSKNFPRRYEYIHIADKGVAK